MLKQVNSVFEGTGPYIFTHFGVAPLGGSGDKILKNLKWQRRLSGMSYERSFNSL